MSELLKSNSEKIIEGLDRNPGLRLVLGLVPYASGFAELFIAHGKNLQEARLNELFRQIDANSFVLNDDLIKNDEFLHRCLVTMRATARTKRFEKIKMLATALIAGSKEAHSGDRFDELFEIIDEISLGEFSVLRILEKFEGEYPQQKSQNKLQRATQFWELFGLATV